MDKFKWFSWNGSKRWLSSTLEAVFRHWRPEGKYIEPFVGGGSVSYLFKDISPDTVQIISDINPWLISAFKCQHLYDVSVPNNYNDVSYWRALKDDDFSKLDDVERATRFAVCLLTSWGNRWKSKPDGSMDAENPVNLKYTRPQYLKKRILDFFCVGWLEPDDVVLCDDWRNVVQYASVGDIIYLDPPYPESLGYGNSWWSFSDQLDIVDWVADAIKRDISVVVSNMATIERLYRRLGMKTIIVDGPKRSKTRTNRQEVIAWYIQN